MIPRDSFWPIEKNCVQPPQPRKKTYLDLPNGAEWTISCAFFYHPLGFKEHPNWKMLNSRVLLPVSLTKFKWVISLSNPRKDDGKHLPISGIINGTATMRSDLQICIQLFFSPQLLKKKGDLVLDVYPRMETLKKINTF